jgi:uncharacterized membrane protein YhaH (DUF805 family)
MFTGDAFLDFVIGISLILSYFFCKHVGEGLTGRIGRKRFLVRQFVIILAWVLLIPLAILPVMGILAVNPTMAVKIILPVILIPTSCFITWFTITTDVKRLHDMNMSGAWFYFLQGMIIVGGGLDIMMLQSGMRMNVAGLAAFVLTRLFLLIVPGTKDHNRFGHNHDKNYLF